MTPWGLVLVTALIAALVVNPTRYIPWLLSLTLALPKTAAIASGPVPLGGFQLVSLVCAPLLLYRITTGGVPDPMRQRATWTLLALVGWAACISALGPTLFFGTEILTSQVENSEGFVVPAPLTYTSSNLAQVAYLGLLLVVFLYLATLPSLSPRLPLLGLGVGMLLSTWRLGSDRLGIPFPSGFFDRSTYLFVDVTSNGSYRLRGVFTEPSVLALYALAALAAGLTIALARRESSRVRLLGLGTAGLAVLNLVFSRSGTGVVAGGVLLGAAVVIVVARGLREGRSLAPTVTVACWAIAAGLVFHERISGYAAGIVDGKVGSTSYGARTASDLEALRLGFRTFGLGVGLGSTRSSSLWTYLFACLGVVGVALFVTLVVQALSRAARSSAWQPAAAALLAAVVAKSVAGSAPAEPVLVFFLALCLAGPRTASPPAHQQESPPLQATSSPPLT